MCARVGVATTVIMISWVYTLRVQQACGTINLAMTLVRLAVALTAFTVSGAAWAEDAPATTGFSLNAPESSLPPALALPAANNIGEAVPAKADQAPKKSTVRRTCTSAGCAYRSVLGKLVITRDLELPGSETVAVRLLPTSSALAGHSRSAIVLRPRVDGSKYGFHLAARF